MKTLTIFTPVYNRANLIHDLYISLCNQKCHDFLWLVVDDGSTDNIGDLMSTYINEEIIEIQYYTQTNGGKMRAHNKGVKMCTTPLFFCVDSDDQLVDNAVQTIVQSYQEIKDVDIVAGILAGKFLKGFSNQSSFPLSGYSTLRALYQHGFKGETSLVFKTNVIKQFPFPELEGEKFITEAYCYDKIDQSYRYLIKDKILTICEYQEDGYTANAKQLFIKYPKGWGLYYAQYYKFYASTLRDKIKYMSYYISMCLLAKQSLLQLLKGSPSIFVSILSLPAGFYIYHRFYKSVK